MCYCASPGKSKKNVNMELGKICSFFVIFLISISLVKGALNASGSAVSSSSESSVKDKSSKNVSTAAPRWVNIVFKL